MKMNVELTKISGKGQIVIPQKIRKKLGIKEGMRFAVYGEDDTVVLKKVAVPTIEEFRKLTKETARPQITDKDIADAIQEIRND
jgi:AbrB family looped-hinge helix DNA binding protein